MPPLSTVQLGQHAPWIFLGSALFLLVPLALLSWRPSAASRPLALLARFLGIALLIFALADLQVVSERPSTGSNVVALLADNSLGMTIADTPQNPTRAETLNAYLTGLNSAWLGELSEQYQLRNYRFDRSLQRLSNFASLSFDGESSNLLNALSDSRDRLAKLPLAGIVVFTDGNATDLERLADLSLEALPPIFPVLVDENSSPSDLAITNLAVSQSAFDDAPLSAKISLLQTSSLNSDLSVELDLLAQKRDGSFSFENIDSLRSPSLDSKGQTAARFNWTPAESGTQFYRVSASRIQSTGTDVEPEATLENNQRFFAVNRAKDRYRILYVTGRPNWEYKFLNRALANDPQIDLVGLIRVAQREPKFEFKGRAGESSNPLYRGFGREDETERYDEAVLIRMNTRDADELRAGFPDTEEDLFAYDAIVIDDLEADFFSFRQQTLLREFAKQRGGGLLLLGGANSLNDGGYQASPLDQALPLYLDRALSSNELGQDVVWSLTREGWVEPWMRIHADESRERDRLNSLPAFRVSHAIDGIKPGTHVLATIQDSLGNSFPGLVTRAYGSGKVACVAVGDFWRSALQGPDQQKDLAKFWRQIARWLVSDVPRQVQLSASLNPQGEVSFNAIARDRSYLPLESGSARLTIRQVASSAEGNSPFEITLPLNAVAERRGEFSATVPLSQAGPYLASVQITAPDGSVVGEAETGWVYEPLEKEFASLTPNTELLQTLAESTGGKLLTLEQIDSLADELEKRPAPVTESYATPLWHNKWLFLAALACFLTEWLIRRRKGLA